MSDDAKPAEGKGDSKEWVDPAEKYGFQLYPSRHNKEVTDAAKESRENLNTMMGKQSVKAVMGRHEKCKASIFKCAEKGECYIIDTVPPRKAECYL